MNGSPLIIGDGGVQVEEEDGYDPAVILPEVRTDPTPIRIPMSPVMEGRPWRMNGVFAQCRGPPCREGIRLTGE